MTTQEGMDNEIKKALEIETEELFPAIYEGYREIEAVAQGEDEILRAIKDAIYEYFQNRNLQTITIKKITEYEKGLGISAEGTTERRRERIREIINRKFVMNDAALLELIQSLQGGATNDFSIDAQNLILQFEKMTNTQGEHEADELKEALETAQPVIPMNLATKLAVLAENELTFTAGYGWTTATSSNLGDVEYVRPPTTLYNVMDISAGTEAQCREPPKLQAIDKGGTMLEGDRAVLGIDELLAYTTIDKGGTMFEGDRNIVGITEQQVVVMDKTPDNT